MRYLPVANLRPILKRGRLEDIDSTGSCYKGECGEKACGSDDQVLHLDGLVKTTTGEQSVEIRLSSCIFIVIYWYRSRPPYTGVMWEGLRRTSTRIYDSQTVLRTTLAATTHLKLSDTLEETERRTKFLWTQSCGEYQLHSPCVAFKPREQHPTNFLSFNIKAETHVPNSNVPFPSLKKYYPVSSAGDVEANALRYLSIAVIS